MSIWNTHSKSLPQEINEVIYFNNTANAVTPRKGQALHYVPALKLSDTTSAITADNLGDVWASAAGASLPVAARARLTTIIADDGDFEFAGVLAEDVPSVPANTGVWVKVVAPGSCAQCLLDDAGTTPDYALGARVIWDISEAAFVAVGTNKMVGAGTAIVLEAYDVSDTTANALRWCKLMVGDGAKVTAEGVNMID